MQLLHIVLLHLLRLLLQLHKGSLCSYCPCTVLLILLQQLLHLLLLDVGGRCMCRMLVLVCLR
jgi:hypothetical protein